MTTATLIFEGKVRDTAGIITAIGGSAATALVVIPSANGLGVTIFLIA